MAHWKYREELSRFKKLRRSYYELLRDELDQFLLQHALIDSYENFSTQQIPFPFVEKREMKPRGRIPNREYESQNAFLVIFVEDTVLPEHKKYIRYFDVNKTTKQNLLRFKTMSLSEKFDRNWKYLESIYFKSFLKILLPVDYALLIQGDSTSLTKNRYGLTHFHVRIDWPITEAAEDMARGLRYISKDIFEKGDKYAEGIQKKFFEYAGPLFSALISPKSSVVSVDKRKKYRVVCRDRSRRLVFEDLEYEWEITQGGGQIQENNTDSVTFIAPSEPCLTSLRAIVRQGDMEWRDEALITVTDSLLDQSSKDAGLRKGLPGYTYRRAPGEIWRSRYDVDKNVIIINNGHRDFVYAGKQKRRKLRYICRLFCKELVRHNFPGMQVDELLERMIELTLYTEEHLK